jgi:hypothetical protein
MAGGAGRGSGRARSRKNSDERLSPAVRQVGVHVACRTMTHLLLEGTRARARSTLSMGECVMVRHASCPSGRT